MGERNGDIQGYYIGHKAFNTTAPYMYLTLLVDKEHNSATYRGEVQIHNLHKFTMYSVHVQAYNSKGAGPRSQDIKVLTLEDGN